MKIVVLNEKTSPQWEVVLRLHGVDICIVTAFATSPVSADLIVGVADKSLVSAYAEMLRSAAFGVEVATNWEFINTDSEEHTNGNEASAPPWEAKGDTLASDS